MLYFHGGGYVTGTCYSHRAITAKFVKGTGISAFLFEYRLAPENPQELSLPYISPLYGNLEGLPPLHIYAGEDETLRDDAIRFGDKAKAEGDDINLRIGEGMFHCYPATAPLFPEATQAFEEICSFIKRSISVKI